MAAVGDAAMVPGWNEGIKSDNQQWVGLGLHGGKVGNGKGHSDV